MKSLYPSFAYILMLFRFLAVLKSQLFKYVLGKRRFAMKKLPLKVMSVALLCAIVFSSSACDKNNNNGSGESGGLGMQETSHRGQKITDDSPWYECTSAKFMPEYDKSKKAQYLYSDLIGADDKYVVVRSSGNYELPADFNWANYSSKDVEIAILTVVDRATMKSVSSVDLTKYYGKSSYMNGLSYSDGKIKAVISDYDSIKDQATNKELTIDPATGKEVESKLLDLNITPGKDYKIGDYKITAVQNWDAEQYYTLTISSSDGNTVSAEVRKAGKNTYDLPAIIPLEDGKALVPAIVENDRCFFELDLKTGSLTEKDAKEYEWLNTDFLFSSIIGRDGMAYYSSPVGIAKIDTKNRKTEQIFSYSWCGENRSVLSSLVVGDITEDSILLCGTTGYGQAYTNSSVNDFTIMQLTKASKNPNAGKTVMELYVPDGYVNEKIADAINKFNTTNSDYFIEVSGRYTDYSAYNYDAQINNEDEMQTASLNGDAKVGTKLAIDLINGEGPDILMNVANFEQLNNANYLVDLSKYIGNLDSEKYFTNIVEASKTDGKLYQLTLCYGIQGIHTDSKYAGASGVGFTTEEYKQFLSKELNGKDLITSGQAVYFTRLFNAMSDKFIVDGKADFSGPEFAELAKYVKENVQERARNWNDPAADGRPYIASGGAVGVMAFKGDRAFAEDEKGFFTTVYGIGTYFYGITGLKGGSAILGIPSTDGRGPQFAPHVSVAISAQSVNADACGEFVKLLLSEEIQESLALNDEFVLSRTAFRKVAQIAVDFYNKDGRNHIYSESDIQKNPNSVITFSKEHIDGLEKIISSCSRSNACDASINLILIEEMPAYFLGQKDLESVIAIAQDRVQKVLSERG